MRFRSAFIAILTLVTIGIPVAGRAAESYPVRPIRVIDGYPAGGPTDFQARVIGPKLTERFGQTVIVDNRPGATGNVGAETAARANPDGHTLLIAASTTLAAGRSLYAKLGYDLMKDFAFVSRTSIGTNVLLAHPSVPAKSVQELVALVRSKPKALRFGSGGVASSTHLAMELLLARTGMQLQHVPYKGGAPLLIALAGGEVEVGFSALTGALPMIQSKRLIALAVAGTKPIASLPGVPPVAESGYPGYSATSTFGVLAPVGTPAAVVRLLNAEIRTILQSEEVRARFAEQGLEASGSTSDEYRALTQAELTQWARVIKDANITAN